MADPLSIVSTILGATNIILDWYIAQKTKEAALEDLRLTVHNVQSVLKPLTDCARDPASPTLSPHITDSLKVILVELLKAKEHLQIWAANSDNQGRKWNKLLTKWKPTLVLNELKDDERRIFNGLMLLNIAFGTHLHIILSSSTVAQISDLQRAKHIALPLIPAENIKESVKFWDQEIGSGARFFMLHRAHSSCANLGTFVFR